MSLRRLNVGFMPLVDCALLVVAQDLGFAAAQDLELVLTRDVSWASVRDRVAYGIHDVAQMPAPLVVADKLGLSPVPMEAVAPMTLGAGGNAVTVSTALWREMGGEGVIGLPPPAETARMLARALTARRARGAPKPVFGIVHPFSSHHYEIAYWMASAGIDPATDVTLAVVPPPMTTDALASGRVDGFCVGAPWNSRAVLAGYGRIVATKAQIWRTSPEKVLAVSERLVRDEPDTVTALIRAIHAAAVWADQPGNRGELAGLLAREGYVGGDPDVIRRLLDGVVIVETDAEPVTIPDFFVFARAAATFPWISHALWLTTQMRRWGQVDLGKDLLQAARAAFRPDLYRKALAGRASLPAANTKVEGALDRPTPVASDDGRLILGPDGFFDGRVFDPDALAAYLAG